MNQSSQRVVITGMGVVTPLACDVGVLWQKLVAGCSAVKRIQRFDVTTFPTQIAAEMGRFQMPDSCNLPREWRGFEPISQYAATAAWNAIEDSGILKARVDPARVGVSLAAGRGSYDHEEIFAACTAAAAANDGKFDWGVFGQQLKKTLKERAAQRRTPGTVPSLIAHHYGFRGPVMATMTACAAGTQALGDAARWIRMGLADIVVTGGADSELFPMGVASFCLLKALSTRNDDPASASRPFDAGRDGFVIGEGAGVMVLEGLDHALRRGALIYAEVVGFGAASDAYRVTDPHPDGRGAVLAMSRALQDAQIDPSQVGYINAHGTSTPANDRIETLAIKEVFGSSAGRIAISSTKSMIGHLTIAAGAVEAIVTALTLANQTIHPTINYESPDPSCDLDYVPNHPRSARVEYALSNSFGFGGQCASLALRTYS